MQYILVLTKNKTTDLDLTFTVIKKKINSRNNSIVSPLPFKKCNYKIISVSASNSLGTMRNGKMHYTKTIVYINIFRFDATNVGILNILKQFTIKCIYIHKHTKLIYYNVLDEFLNACIKTYHLKIENCQYFIMHSIAWIRKETDTILYL